MADLDDFFKKKDKAKKKKGGSAIKTSELEGAATAAAANAEAAAQKIASEQAAEGGGQQQTQVTSPRSPTGQKEKDDGWVDIEDNRSAQVYTGGRSVVRLEKYVASERSNCPSIWASSAPFVPPCLRVLVFDLPFVMMDGILTCNICVVSLVLGFFLFPFFVSWSVLCDSHS